MLRADPAAQRAARRTTRDTWIDHGILAAAFAILLGGFSPVLHGGDWWITAVLVVLLAGVTCGVLRALGVRWVGPIALVVELVALAWIFVPSTLLIVFPSPSTISAFGDLFSSAHNTILIDQAPVTASKPVVFLLASAFGLLVIVADELLERARSAVTIGALLLAVFLTPAMIAGKTPSVWLFVVVAALWLMILRSRTRQRTTGTWQARLPVLLVTGAALGTALVLPPVLPDITAVATEWGKPPPSVFGRDINPILRLGQNLRRNSETVALRYTTTKSSPEYLKVATLRNFTGKTWKPSGTSGKDRFEGQVGLHHNIKAHEDSTKITITNLRSVLLPVPYPAEDVSGLKGTWLFQRMGQTIKAQNSDTHGQTYSVKSLTIEPTAKQMRQLVTVVGPSLQPFVALPNRMPAIIAETARKVTSNAPTDYDKALALQRYLRNGAFTYSTTAPVAHGYDGNGVDVIAAFLKQKQGYCVHFSSTMAVMARTLGIPSRVAVGYAPGKLVGVSDSQNIYQNTSNDLHAWPELYFEGAGWIGFEPTPGVGSPTAFAEPKGAKTPDTVNNGNDLNKPGDTGQSNQADTQNRGGSTVLSPTTASRTAGVTTASLFLLLLVPWLLRVARRRWRMRPGARSPDRLWRELEDTAQDFGVPSSIADTPRGFAGRLRVRPAVDAEALDRLLVRVEQTRYSRQGSRGDSGVQDLRAVIASIKAGATRVERLRAMALPRSLAGRRNFIPVPQLAS
jgi:transglutaminase-like putative cysteine protease